MFYLNFIAANELFLQKDPNAFFPPISTSQTKKPYSSLVNNYHKKVERCRITLEENDERMSASSPKSQEQLFEDKSLELLESNQVNTAQVEFVETEKVEESKLRDQETQTSAGLYRNISPKKRKSVNITNEIKEEKSFKPNNNDITRIKRAKSKSRASEGKAPSTISPILEDQDEDQVEIDFNDMYSKRGNTNDELSMNLDLNDKHLSSSFIPPAKSNQSPRPQSDKSTLSVLERKAPYFISGGFIPNSILIRILWPPAILNEAVEKEKSFWKPKDLTKEQMAFLKPSKSVVSLKFRKRKKFI